MRYFRTWNSDRYLESSTLHQIYMISGLIECNIGKFLWDNFKQAIEIVNTYPERLEELMETLEVSTPEIFDEWKQEELKYLSDTKTEPVQAVLEMDYLQLLKELADAEYVWLL